MTASDKRPSKVFAICQETSNQGVVTIIRRQADGKVLVRVNQYDLPTEEVPALMELHQRLAIALEDERRQGKNISAM